MASAGDGMQTRLNTLLETRRKVAGFPAALLCTAQGLLLAAVGDTETSEIAAGLTSLFDDIALRAQRDLHLQGIDELTLRADNGERYVIRPLSRAHKTHFYLVVQVPRNGTWRRETNTLVRSLAEALTPFMDAVENANA